MEDAAESVRAPLGLRSQSSRLSIEKAVAILENVKHRDKKVISRMVSNLAYWDVDGEDYQVRRIGSARIYILEL